MIFATVRRLFSGMLPQNEGCSTLGSKGGGGFDVSSGSLLSEPVKNLSRAGRKRVLAELATRMESLGEGAGSVGFASEGMADNASEQAAAIMQLGSDLDQIALRTAHNADEAQASRDTLGEALGIHDEASEAVHQLTHAIEALSETREQTKCYINSIQDIARRTHLLAINASIEAARAGQAGAGFAVVAGEVQELAKSAGQAASEITRLLEESNREVESAKQNLAVTNVNLERFQNNSDLLERCVVSIAEHSREQSDRMGEMQKTIVMIDQATQKNALASETTANFARDLKLGIEQGQGLLFMLTGRDSSKGLQKMNTQLGRDTRFRKLEDNPSSFLPDTPSESFLSGESFLDGVDPFAAESFPPAGLDDWGSFGGVDGRS